MGGHRATPAPERKGMTEKTIEFDEKYYRAIENGVYKAFHEKLLTIDFYTLLCDAIRGPFSEMINGATDMPSDDFWNILKESIKDGAEEAVRDYIENRKEPSAHEKRIAKLQAEALGIK